MGPTQEYFSQIKSGFRQPYGSSKRWRFAGLLNFFRSLCCFHCACFGAVESWWSESRSRRYGSFCCVAVWALMVCGLLLAPAAGYQASTALLSAAQPYVRREGRGGANEVSRSNVTRGRRSESKKLVQLHDAVRQPVSAAKRDSRSI